MCDDLLKTVHDRFALNPVLLYQVLYKKGQHMDGWALSRDNL